jgi:hypothetical protein
MRARTRGGMLGWCGLIYGSRRGAVPVYSGRLLEVFHEKQVR